MDSRLKFFTIVLVTFAFVGALLYMPLTGATLEASENEASATECANQSKLELVWWLLNNSEPEDVKGNVVTFFKDMLIVNMADDQVRIALPEEWTVGTDVVAREMLFGSGYLSMGENVTVKALRADIIEKQSLNIYFSIGYEIIDDEGVHAYAALPLNIET